MKLEITTRDNCIKTISITDILMNLNYNIMEESQRSVLIKKLFENEEVIEYFSKYFEQNVEDGIDVSHFKVGLIKSDKLSENNFVCKALSLMADYLIFAPDSKPLVSKFKYTYYTHKNLKKRIKRESSLESIINKICKDTSEKYDKDIVGEVIDFFERTVVNYRNEIKQEVFIKDKDNTIIADYDYFKDQIIDLLKEIDNIGIENVYSLEKIDIINEIMLCNRKDYVLNSNVDLNNKYDKKKLLSVQNKLIKKLRGQITTIKDDQLLSKDMLNGTIYFKSAEDSKDEPSYLEHFRFNDFKHVRALLRIAPRSIETELGILTQDMKNILKNVKLNGIEKKVVGLYREDLTELVISETIGTTQQNVSRIIDRVVNKIIKYYNEQWEDWVNLNYIRGSYKKCSRCGEIKLVQRFDIDNSKKDNRKSMCKECRM